MANKIMIDPPSGWRYGFPKAIPKSRLKDVHAWLVEKGYPEAAIKALGKYFHYRLYEVAVKSKKNDSD